MRSIEFSSGERERVRGVLFDPDRPQPSPVILFAHGLLSSHEEFGDYPDRFCKRGYLVLAIDFRGHGASDGMRGLISQERTVEDLVHALDWVETLPGVDRKRIALFGHSFGGAAVICTAARDARVAAVVAGATIGRLKDEVSGGQRQVYRLMDVINRLQKAITHKSLYVPYPITYKDIFADPQARQAAEAKGFLQTAFPVDDVPHLLRQDAIACARNVRVPALVVRGGQDQAVQHSSVERVYNALAGEKELYEVEGSGHSFATDWKGAEAYEHIAAWLDRHLLTGRAR